MRARPWADLAAAALLETTDSLLARLTPAQRKVAVALAPGRTDQQIADLLHMSRKTVSWYLHKIYKEHGVSGRGELIALVLRDLDDPV
jgi:DNA-binding CsgD family transcriptional regulator